MGATPQGALQPIPDAAAALSAAAISAHDSSSGGADVGLLYVVYRRAAVAAHTHARSNSAFTPGRAQGLRRGAVEARHVRPRGGRGVPGGARGAARPPRGARARRADHAARRRLRGLQPGEPRPIRTLRHTLRRSRARSAQVFVFKRSAESLRSNSLWLPRVDALSQSPFKLTLVLDSSTSVCPGTLASAMRAAHARDEFDFAVRTEVCPPHHLAAQQQQQQQPQPTTTTTTTSNHDDDNDDHHHHNHQNHHNHHNHRLRR